MKPPKPFADREPTPDDWALCKSCRCILSGNPSQVVAEGIGNIADAYLLVDAKKTAEERDQLLAACKAAIAPGNREHLGLAALGLLEAAIAKAREPDHAA